jgi:hypothetical protein
MVQYGVIDCEERLQKEMEVPTHAQFAGALREIAKPGGRQQLFLRAHVRARRGLTARRLAQAAGYQNHGGINLRYGLLAQQIGAALHRRDVHLSLLVDFRRPNSDAEWVLVMHPQFAAALKEAGWV